MAITGKTSGILINTPATMVASASPTSRLVKDIVINNLDTISHNLTITVGVTIVKMLLKPGDNLHFGSTIVLGSDNLVGSVGEAIITTNPTFNISYLDEAETV